MGPEALWVAMGWRRDIDGTGQSGPARLGDTAHHPVLGCDQWKQDFENLCREGLLGSER